MAQSMLVIGRKIDNMVMVLNHGPMMLVMREIMNTERSTVSELLSGPMVPLILVNFTTITYMEKEFTLGLIIENTRATGELIRCMAKELLTGLTAENTSVNMQKTKRKDMVNLFGQMEDAIEANGLMVNNMAKELTLLLQVKKNTASGKTVNVQDGLVEEKMTDKIIIGINPEFTNLYFIIGYNI